MKKPFTILMKVTSRERPEQLLKCVSEYVRLANNTKDMVWLFTTDTDDLKTTGGTMAEIYKLIPSDSKAMVFTGLSTDKINAINRDVDELEKISFDKQQTYPVNWDILLNISDDQLPIVKGYDDKIRETMPDHLDASLWFSDGVQPRINTMEILGRTYYKNQGFIYDPRFKSFFCDNLSTMIAEKSGKLIKFKECLIRHFHPAHYKNTHLKYDELYKRNDLHWKHDEDLFNQLVKEL